MPIFNGLLTYIDKSEMLRYANIRNEEDIPQTLIQDAIEELQILASPMGIYQEYSYNAQSYTVSSDPPLYMIGNSIRNHLSKASKVYVLCATIGEAVEDRISTLFKDGQYTLGLLLDAAATTAVEQVANQLNEVIDGVAKKDGYTNTWRFSPGYGDWPVDAQKVFSSIIKTEEINVHVTETSMLFPRKSVTAIIGAMQQGVSTTPKGCASCTQKNCSYRHNR